MKTFIRMCVLTTVLLFVTTVQAYDGRIIDAQTKAPVVNAVVTLNNDVVLTAKDGTFHISGTGETLKLRAAGYTRAEIPTSTLSANQDLTLKPFTVRALYLTGYGLASHQLRNAALETAKKNNMNALVIDMKGDRGFIPFKVNIPMADKIGAQKLILIKDAQAVFTKLKQQNFYLIARIVVFKDDLLAEAHPEWMIKKNGQPFLDGEKLHWVDASQRGTWDYNIAIAKAAAEMGFDEVHFDYVRFPDSKGVTFSKPSTEENRTQAITGFLTAAHKALAPYNVMVTAAIFGYAAWNTGDTTIGQDITKIAPAVDAVSLMLYPSGFHLGIPNYRNPVQHPYEIIHLSMKRAQERTGLPAMHFRPWLQAFRDYAFGRVQFGEDRMYKQVKASNDLGSSGYMFWNPRNVYPKGNFTGPQTQMSVL
jgi:hypothetical protein